MQTLLTLSIALFAGLMLSRLAKLVKLPAVTAYLVAGILVGPYFLGALGVKGLGFISMENIKSFAILSDVALGFIAFSIGNEFRLAQLKKTGKQATVIGIIQAVAATLLVDAALIGLHFIIPDKLPLPSAIVLGAVASATAPAATMMVVKQYKADGPLTRLLMLVVAIDDAVGLVLFSVSYGIANAIVVGGMGRERNLVIDTRLEDFTPITNIKGEVNKIGLRRMTPREWARLQGFPDNFIIGISDASAYKQFGNSVAIPAVQATAKEIIKRINIPN